MNIDISLQEYKIESHFQTHQKYLITFEETVVFVLVLFFNRSFQLLGHYNGSLANQTCERLHVIMSNTKMGTQNAIKTWQNFNVFPNYFVKNVFPAVCISMGYHRISMGYYHISMGYHHILMGYYHISKGYHHSCSVLVIVQGILGIFLNQNIGSNKKRF
uniref:Transmembrane protein n=1 Tax=Pyxicephalus adspersus TaxID=30357 RepID=A0AAV2ZTL6_PYXAD|nr:TPA: hypothetical protein GDO54_002936 [Pyxicephalus adspersus]